MEDVCLKQKIDIESMIQTLKEQQNNGYKWAFQNENGETQLTEKEPGFAMFSRVWNARGKSVKLKFGFLNLIQRGKFRPITIYDLIASLHKIQKA